MRLWHRRYFQLRSSSLVYRTSEHGSARGRIALAQVTDCFAFDGHVDVIVTLRTSGGRDFLLKAPTRSEAEEWVSAIKAAKVEPPSAAELLMLSRNLQLGGVLDQEVGTRRRWCV